MSTYTQYTGTFTKTDVITRTMIFIKVSDLPTTRFSNKQRIESSGDMQTVWDTDNHGFRTFNRSRIVGSINSKNINYSFDKS